jgi:hypothetical protein
MNKENGSVGKRWKHKPIDYSRQYTSIMTGGSAESKQTNLAESYTFCQVPSHTEDSIPLRWTTT